MAQDRSSFPQDPAEADAPAATRPTPNTGAGRDLAIGIARLLTDFHCEQVRVFDVTGISPLTHFIVIASGTSDRQIRGLQDRVDAFAREQGYDRFGQENDGATTWLVLDYVEAMVHLFEPATRAHYDLEMLWGDAPEIAWQQEARD